MEDRFTVTLEEDDFIEVFRPAPRPRRVSFLLLLLALALTLLIIALLVRFPGAQAALLASPVTMGLVGAVVLAASLVAALLIAAPALRRRAARSTLATHPGLRDPICYTFDAERFSVRTTYTQAQYPWAELWDWRESERVVIVLPSPRNFYVIPKRGLEPLLLTRLKSNLAHARNRNRNA
jgi:hypothetical protein